MKKRKHFHKAPKATPGAMFTPLGGSTQRGGVGMSNATQGPNGPTKYETARPVQPPTNIADVDPGRNIYSPMQPVQPFGPPWITTAREWDYISGYNIDIAPAHVVFMQNLRLMAQSWGILATVIQTRIDQIMRQPWAIQVKDQPKKKNARLDELTEFFRKPDGKTRWDRWCRLLLYEMLVTDAASIDTSWRTNDGKPVGVSIIDGATIKPLIDDGGRRPDWPSPAYQQLIKGLPMVNLTERELIYAPMRPRPQMPIYGYPGTEQIVTEIVAGISRAQYQALFWKEGTMPEMIMTVPDSWNPQQVAQFQAMFDALMAGNQQTKSRIRFVPGGMKPFDIKNANGEGLKADIDEWLTRICCFAFSVSPTPFIRQMNRACYSADTETLTENGWKFFPDVEEGEKIATYNPTTSQIEYHVPIKKFAYQFDGEMVAFRSTNVDVLVTPEHKMWLRGDHAESFSKTEAYKAPRSQFYFLAKAEPYDGDDCQLFTLPLVDGQKLAPLAAVPMDDWLEFLGYAISQGGLSHKPAHHMMTLAQRLTGDGVARIDSVLSRLGLSFTKYPPSAENCARWNVYGKQLSTWLKANIGGYAGEKRIPRVCFSLCFRQRRILFDALMLGDGWTDHRENRVSSAYTTVSSQLADDVQELAFSIGLCASVSVAYEASDNKQKAYRVSVSSREVHSLRGAATQNTPAAVSRLSYSGSVYCFEVPNHLFVTRRNGKIGIHGNTAETAQETSEEEGLLPTMTWLKTEIMDPLIQEEEFGFGYDDIEFKWQEETEVNPELQMTVITGFVKEGVMTRNEGRDQLGLEEMDGGDELTVDTVNGPVPIAETVEANRQKALAVPDQIAQQTETHQASLQQMKSPAPSVKGPALFDLVKFDPTEARAEDGKWTASWHSSLTGDQKSAFKKYISEDYQDVNSLLRKGKMPSGRYGDIVKTIDSAMKKAVLPTEKTLYRGVSASGVAALSGKIAKGSVIKDAGFTSTSAELSVAKFVKNFANQSSDHLIIEIKAPAGSRAAPVAALGDIPDEREYLIPRGASFRVDDYSPSTRTLRVSLLQ